MSFPLLSSTRARPRIRYLETPHAVNMSYGGNTQGGDDIAARTALPFLL